MTLDQRYKETKGWTASHLVQDAIANFGGDWQVSEQQEERFKAAELKDSADSFAVRGARPMPIGRALTQKDCIGCNIPTFERVRVARQYVKKGSPFITKALCVDCQTEAAERRDEGTDSMSQCAYCGDPPESTVHDVHSENTEIRMGAHTFLASTDNYVAWCRYTKNGPIVTCDSDAPGAFKVYRKATA